MAVGRPRDEVVLDRHRVGAGHVFGGDDALGLGDVREHHLGRAVTDGVDAGHVGLAVVVDGDGSPLGEGDAGGLEAVALGAGGEADRGQQLVGLQDLLVATSGWRNRHAHTGSGVLDGLDLGAEQDLDAQLLVVLEELLGDICILGRHHPVEELDDGHIDTEVLHDVGELDTDGTGPGDDDRPGQLGVEDLLLVGHDVLAHLHPGEHPGHGTRRDDQLVEGQLAGGPVVERHRHPLRAGQGAPSVDLGDLVLLHEEVHALDDPRGHLTRARVRRGVGHAHLTLDAVLRLVMGQQVGQLGILQQRLRGDAADVEAHTAPVLLLDHGNLHTELRGADRRDVSTRTSTEHHEIEISHDVSLVRGVRVSSFGAPRGSGGQWGPPSPRLSPLG